MCDTFVAVNEATADGSVILGKNSDREPNEAQPIVRVPATEYAPDCELRTTYVTVPQVRRTRAVLLSKPYWIWGAEMGVNDAGVAIGNEAVFTKAKREADPGLLGMDLLRLALERAGDAEEAVAVITDMLATYGQAGNAGHTADMQYDNSYLIADPSRAVVLETVGREWAVSRVDGTRSISNGLTLRGDFDAASAGLQGAKDIAGEHSDFLYTRFSDSAKRQCRTRDALAAVAGGIRVADAMALLRDHGEGGQKPSWTPAAGLFGQTVCAHAGFGPVRVSQSTGSLVAQLRPEGSTVWLTGTSAPCLSVFKPIWMDTGLPDLGPEPDKYYDGSSLWWRHEDLHRAVLSDYANRAATLRERIAAIEEELQTQTTVFADAYGPDTRAERAALTARAFAVAARAEREALAQLRQRPAPPRRHLLYRRAWAGFDKAAQRGTES